MKCPNCGVELNLTLSMVTNEARIKTNAVGRSTTFRMNGKPYTLSDSDIVEAARTLESPNTIRDYFVKLKSKKGKIEEFPIKQVVREALRSVYLEQIPEDYFTSQRARNILEKLHFAVNTKK